VAEESVETMDSRREEALDELVVRVEPGWSEAVVAVMVAYGRVDERSRASGRQRRRYGLVVAVVAVFEAALNGMNDEASGDDEVLILLHVGISASVDDKVPNEIDCMQYARRVDDSKRALGVAAYVEYCLISWWWLLMTSSARSSI
jgi:hypothetical protein